MKRYEGQRTWRAVKVTVNGNLLNPRLDLRNHSPSGFDWGYCGSGPAQLALAILADHLADDEQALDSYQCFKWSVIAELPKRGWTLTSAQVEESLQILKSSSPQALHAAKP